MKNEDENAKLPMVSSLQLEVQQGQVISENLTKSVCEQLAVLMVTVTKQEVNPSTVNAACNCASQIHKILLLNEGIKRKGRR